MDSPLLTSVVLALGVLLSFLALLVESQGNNNNNNNNNHVSPPYYSPPPPVSPPPPPPPPSPPHSHPLAPPMHPNRRPRHSNSTQPAKGHRRHRNGEKLKKEKHNVGKKVGFWFLGVAALLQVCAAGFLIFKRRQLFKDQDILL